MSRVYQKQFTLGRRIFCFQVIPKGSDEPYWSNTVPECPGSERSVRVKRYFALEAVESKDGSQKAQRTQH
tara:strand:- start:539 stop:748 length:210 start_codon:yes stop_codon:yes gene_type:complete